MHSHCIFVIQVWENRPLLKLNLNNCLSHLMLHYLYFSRLRFFCWWPIFFLIYCSKLLQNLIRTVTWNIICDVTNQLYGFSAGLSLASQDRGTISYFIQVFDKERGWQWVMYKAGKNRHNSVTFLLWICLINSMESLYFLKYT